MKREDSGRHFLIRYTLLALLMSMSGCEVYLGYLFNPQKADETSMLPDFVVIALPPSGKARLLTLHELGSRTPQGMEPVVVPESDVKYTFFIEPSRLKAVEEAINAENAGNNTSHNFVQLIETDEAHRKQVVKLDEWKDDYNFIYVYEVRNGRVIPLTYTDIVKAKGARALVLMLFIFVLLEAIVLMRFRWGEQTFVRHALGTQQEHLPVATCVLTIARASLFGNLLVQILFILWPKDLIRGSVHTVFPLLFLFLVPQFICGCLTAWCILAFRKVNMRISLILSGLVGMVIGLLWIPLFHLLVHFVPLEPVERVLRELYPERGLTARALYSYSSILLYGLMLGVCEFLLVRFVYLPSERMRAEEIVPLSGQHD